MAKKKGKGAKRKSHKHGKLAVLNQGKSAKRKGRKPGKPIADAEAFQRSRRQRWNPMRYLTPESLARALDAFEYGDLREFAVIAEVIAERDDVLKSVKPKREMATAHRDWNINQREKSPAADKQREVLEDFWNNVRAVNAYDRNERGGMARLIRQMMTAVSFRYANHHIVWKPEPGKLRAVFEFVPLWFFENRTGQLRFVRDGIGIEGEEMDPSEWMTTVGDGLMIACSIASIAKRYCIQDWLAFSEKFSMPGILGVTPHGKDTPEGKAMKQATDSFSQDWSAVLYGTDPSIPDPIRLVQPNGNPTAMPMPALIERVDRKMAALYRGADLSTMSSKDGEGTGASLQDSETEVLEADDCQMVSETLQQIDRQVIEWHFGKGTEVLAYIEVQPPVREDKKFLLEAMEFLESKGVRVSKGDALERLGFSIAEDDEEALGEGSRDENDKAPKPKKDAKSKNSEEKPDEDPDHEANAKLPGGWIEFASETGTLGIPRSVMPQIRQDNRAAMINFLKVRGVIWKEEVTTPADLKPTQAEYHPEKVSDASMWKRGMRKLLVSADNYVVDGHHQWMSHLATAPNQKITVMRLNSPIMHVIGLLLMMPSTEQALTNSTEAVIGRLRVSHADDLQALGIELERAVKEGEPRRSLMLRQLSARLGTMLGSPALEEALGVEMAWALAAELFPTTREP
ncbi:MAG: DUF935 family protein [Verrucomicrobiota bacterium]